MNDKKIPSEQNVYESVVSKITAILSGPLCVK